MDNVTNIDTSNTASILPGMETAAPAVTAEDVEAIFGTQESGEANDSAGRTSTGSNQTGQEDYTGKTADEIARMFQSRYDKANNMATSLQQENARLKEFESFFNTIYEDEQVKEAFLYELAPDKFKPQEPHTFVEEGLAKEFGKEFEPDPRQERTPGSKTWLYYKRADDLYKQAISSREGGTAKGLKELKAEREKVRVDAQRKAFEQKQELVNKFKWDKPTTDNFLQWANSLNLVNLGSVYQFALTQKGKLTRSPSLAAQSGGAPLMPNELQTHLKNMFG
ncbi:MAG TPA: hypothetical protein VMV86_05650 [Methanosarcinales archaeon]|nr:hypothetical protein [Methanosarcinales archaeon]